MKRTKEDIFVYGQFFLSSQVLPLQCNSLKKPLLNSFKLVTLPCLSSWFTWIASNKCGLMAQTLEGNSIYAPLSILMMFISVTITHIRPVTNLTQKTTMQKNSHKAVFVNVHYSTPCGKAENAMQCHIWRTHNVQNWACTTKSSCTRILE